MRARGNSQVELHDANLRCTSCGRNWPPNLARWRCDCGGPLEIADAPVAVLTGSGFKSQQTDDESAWQQRVAAFMRRHHLLHDPATHALDLLSEVGEVAKEVLLATDYGRRPSQSRPELADELGDALYSLLALAEACGVDGEDALRAALEKYQRRIEERGGAGSV